MAQPPEVESEKPDPLPSRGSIWGVHGQLPVFPILFAAVGVVALITGVVGFVSSPPHHIVRSVRSVPLGVAALLLPVAIVRSWRLARRRSAVDRFSVWFGSLLSALGTVGLVTIAMSGPMLIATIRSSRPDVGLTSTLTLAVVFLFIVAQCVSATRTVWTEQGRAHLRRALARIGAAASFLFPIALFINVLVLFALATSYLVAWGVASFAQDQPSNARVVAFYCWHFLDLVPLIDVPQTLHWSRPLTYPDWRIGLLVLGFELTGVLPVIALIRVFWRLRTTGESDGDSA